MFFDIGPLELIALIILAVLVFGPDKLPKVIQDVAGFIRKVREFSDNAKQDIRSELGPEFKDFEFEDLNPKTFARKHLLDKDELGLKEIRNGFDLRKEMAEVADAVNGREGDRASGPALPAPASGTSSSNGSDLLRKRDSGGAVERPPFDSDAT
ncbi:sec-independent translocase [Streptomyces sp. LX-29]|uniref:sec-independent translocase n=1 Tax=Streptomyces sp. LX-29 TaxID=2900152 RepID=UPI00240D6985|nr:sec-independent translocase [Streptomyces sp. LX-29]WFB07563.1 sec-independent translocase [Streptomyces sp. LX-29]